MLRGFRRVYRRLKRVTSDYKGLQEVKGVTTGYMGL